MVMFRILCCFISCTKIRPSSPPPQVDETGKKITPSPAPPQVAKTEKKKKPPPPPPPPVVKKVAVVDVALAVKR
ncbi:glyceraldehyde-3-phosphate dehydrogenase, testis-specific [Eutrema salsugineum]|uniref:glyceraldehyde-3-phosphate dehydrogenase, testis-specific n=1 Tax=Eutrema salsugineum TaxID=72664 RepID=UPI000CED7A97|nr:glyceraldehyde-3-phosphate dehydrogenase, testis-specific [Eutrema salsugineum]